MIEAISTKEAPTAIGPYSQAIRCGNLLFISGQLGIDPATGEFAGDSAIEQMRQCLANLAAIAGAAGSNLSKTIKTTILLTDLSEFTAINDVYGAAFARPYPARATFEVSALPKAAKVEVEAVVALD